MTEGPLEKLLGKIEDVSVESGIQPRMRITVNVTNKNDCGFVVIGFAGRLHILFSDVNRGWGGQMGQYIAELEYEGYYRSVQRGDQNTLTLLCADFLLSSCRVRRIEKCSGCDSPSEHFLM